MPTPFKKKKIIRKIYREQKRMLDEELAFSADHDLSPEELAHLQQHAEEIRAELSKLVPRRPLDIVSAMVRIGIAIIIFILLMIPPYSYYRGQYFAPQVATSTSATGNVVVTNYIAASPAAIVPRLWRQTDMDGPISLATSTNLAGMVAGIIPVSRGPDAKTQGIAVYYTEPVNNKMILRRIVTDDFFRSVFTTSSTVWDDHDFLQALALNNASSSIVAASYKEASGGGVSMQLLDRDGKPKTNRIELRLDSPNESADGFQLTPWEDGWAMTTRIPRGPGSSLFDPTRIIVRFLDKNLRVSTTTNLEISGYEIASYPILVPNLGGMKGYSLVAGAHPLIRSQREKIGDELYAFGFNADRELVRMVRLTNNGREHDYDTTGFAIAQNNNFMIGAHNIPLASLDDPGNSYPPGSGRAYLRFFDQSFNVAGTIIVYDDPAAPKGQSDSIGVAHLHQAMINGRIYMAYDRLNSDESESNGPQRLIIGSWIRAVQN